jgi:hypothetical protein
MIRQHEQDIKKLMKSIKIAINRPFNFSSDSSFNSSNNNSNNNNNNEKTTVIIQTAGRIGNSDPAG